MADLAFLAGALVGSALLTALAHWLSRKWPLSYGKVALINLNVAVFAVLFSAIGAADGGPPNFSTAPLYLFAQILIFIVDLIRARGQKARVTA